MSVTFCLTFLLGVGSLDGHMEGGGWNNAAHRRPRGRQGERLQSGILPLHRLRGQYRSNEGWRRIKSPVDTVYSALNWRNCYLYKTLKSILYRAFNLAIICSDSCKLQVIVTKVWHTWFYIKTVWYMYKAEVLWNFKLM